MEDIVFITKCNHQVKNYELKIVKEGDGSYTATFPYPLIMDKRYLFIRSWEDEQKYLSSLTDYTDIPVNIRNISNTAPVTGIVAEIGITDYDFLSEYKIKFFPTNGVYPVNIDSRLVPPNKYLADIVFNPKKCPRCAGTGVVKDIAVNNLGKLNKVTGIDKIKQRVIKALITPLGMSPYNEQFGSELNLLVGSVVTDTTRIILQKTIVNCIENLIKDQPTDLPADERIHAIGGITIDTPDEDKTTIYVKITVISAIGYYIDCSVGFNLGDK